MEIRAERPDDIQAIYQVNVAAFERKGEADLVDRLRGGLSTFSFVAVAGDQIIGHLFFSPVEIEQPGWDVNEGFSGADSGVLGLAPVAVLPDYQGQGIGSLLIQQQGGFIVRGENLEARVFVDCRMTLINLI